MDITIQIFGTKKCKDTQKAIRFFKERGIKPHFIDLNEKALSKGELTNVANKVGLEHMLDTNSKEYNKLQLEYKVFDLETKLLEHPLLLKTPIVRNSKLATIGLEPDAWKMWLK